MRTRGTMLVIVILLIVAAVFAWKIFNPGPMAFAGGSTVALADYGAADPTGAPADLANSDVVKRGEYLARAADCRACHTVSRDRLYAGGLPIPLPFGTLYSTNITPDKETGIGNYSDQDFLNAVQRGIRPDGTRLYPAMPFPSYTRMTDADALAIKAYLFSLPAVRAQNLPSTFGFPYNQRWLMGLWSAFFNENSRFRPVPTQSAEWNRGAYLAEALAHCGECHTPRNLALALDNRNKFAGALTAGWYAFNISSDNGSGIGAWNDDEVRNYLSTGHAAGRGTAAGPMGEAVDQSFKDIASSDIRALVTYVRSVPPIASPDLPAKLAPPAASSPREGNATTEAVGKRVFEGACVHCHDWSGVSQLSPFATIAGTRGVNDRTATNVVQIVISGTTRHTPDGVISMPAFGSAYSDTEIAAVANYVTARFGAERSKLTDKDVAELRRQAAD
ncbi:MAG TPA: cytochrome c [Xanthobacteraceae bacterium]|nr:cytochrome c [Xanthobacteraceae bacterium]